MLQNNSKHTTGNIDWAYRNFYRVYNIFNRIAWSGRLPDCMICFSRRRSRRSLAFAVNTFPPRITFNIDNCLRHPESFIWGIAAHEMTHIWQYTNGSRGGHGKDFYREMLRIGFDEKRGLVIADSAADYIFSLNEMYRISLAASLVELKKYSSCDKEEFASQYNLNKPNNH
jgi:hypothetical protein